MKQSVCIKAEAFANDYTKQERENMLKYLKKYWLFTMLAPLFMIGEVSMDLIQPELMSHIIDDGVLGINSGGVGNLDIILGTGIRMVLLVAAGGVCGVMSGVFANLSAQQFGNDVRKDTFKRIMSFSFEQTDKFSTGSLITRVTNDITQLQNFVMQCMRGFVRTSMLFIGGIVCMIGLNIQLCAQLRVCSQAGGNPVYPRFSQPDNSESWDDVGNGI